VPSDLLSSPKLAWTTALPSSAIDSVSICYIELSDQKDIVGAQPDHIGLTTCASQIHYIAKRENSPLGLVHNVRQEIVRKSTTVQHTVQTGPGGFGSY